MCIFDLSGLENLTPKHQRLVLHEAGHGAVTRKIEKEHSLTLNISYDFTIHKPRERTDIETKYDIKPEIKEYDSGEMIISNQEDLQKAASLEDLYDLAVAGCLAEALGLSEERPLFAGIPFNEALNAMAINLNLHLGKPHSDKKKHSWNVLFNGTDKVWGGITFDDFFEIFRRDSTYKKIYCSLAFERTYKWLYTDEGISFVNQEIKAALIAYNAEIAKSEESEK